MDKTEDGIPVRTLYIPDISIYVSEKSINNYRPVGI